MLEVIALLALLAAAALLFAGFVLVTVLVKLAFKILLFPIKLAGGLVLGVLGLIAALMLALVALPVLAVAVPVVVAAVVVAAALALVAGIGWLGFQALAWIF